MKSANATDIGPIAASVVAAPPRVITALTNASSVQAVTSSTAAHVRAVSAERRRRELTLLEDASEHGECRNAHGHAKKQGKGMKRHVGRCVGAIDEKRQRHAEDEWNGDAEMADRNRCLCPSFDVRSVELDSDHEHEQEHADLAEHLENRQGTGPEEGSAGRWCQDPQNRWPDDDAGGNLANHGGLPACIASQAQIRAALTMGDKLHEQPNQRLSCIVDHLRQRSAGVQLVRWGHRGWRIGQHEAANRSSPATTRIDRAMVTA